MASEGPDGVPDGGMEDRPAQVMRAEPDHLGHRDRLRQRFTISESSLQDYEVLEMFLFRYIPRRDTKPIARELLARFGSLKGVFHAPRKELMRVANIGERLADDLRVTSALFTRMQLERVIERPVLSSWSAVIDYCTAKIANAEREQFRVLYLDKKNRLLDDVQLHEGTVDHTPVYPREVIRHAFDRNSTALIMVHNHPSGDPTPSTADIEMTRKVVEACAATGIVVHDHIVIGAEGHVSFRALRLI